jgi:DNA-binding XRE family transcriptional regulator
MQETRAVQTIRELRRQRGWTQFELALAVGVQPQTVYLWESGRRVPQVPQLRKLGEVFGLCSDLIDLEPSPDRFQSPPHRASSERHAGDVASGRDAEGRAARRGDEGFPVRHQERQRS